MSSTRQPRGLYLLFFTELWERFGYYTIQTILILYMTKALLMSDQHANYCYAAFGSLLFLTPMLGGYLADRYLGFQRAIVMGGVLFIIGYLVCLSRDESLFFIGLSILICANGLFKPNVSAILGDLYQQDDSRRDSGFTLFYMGMNVGALIPPIIAGALIARCGWHSGFAIAAMGMVLGQVIFMRGKKHLGRAGVYPKANHKQAVPGLFFYILFSVGTFLAITCCYQAFRFPELIIYVMEFASILVLGVVLFFIAKEPPEQRKKMIACVILIAISVVFWSLYNTALPLLFADRNMEKHFLGLPFDAEATQFFNPFFIIILSPVISKLWLRMDTFGMNPSTQMKFFLGVLLMSLGFLLLAYGASHWGVSGLISPWLLCGCYLLQSLGELLISPIGLAMITVLCPKHLVGMMMGVWFFSQAASFAIGGVMANIAVIPQASSSIQSLPIYSHAFYIYGFVSLGMAGISFLLLPLLNYLVSSRNDAYISEPALGCSAN